MVSMILYFALAIACVILYFYLSREAYLSGRNAFRTEGTIKEVILSEGAEAYLLQYRDPHGVMHELVSPRYASRQLVDRSADEQPSGLFAAGDSVQITCRSFHLFKLHSVAMRIDDERLVRTENYKSLLALSGILFLFAVLRVITSII